LNGFDLLLVFVSVSASAVIRAERKVELAEDGV